MKLKFLEKVDVLVQRASSVVASQHIHKTATPETEALRNAILDFETGGETLQYFSTVKLFEGQKKTGTVEDTVDISEEAKLLADPLCIIGQGSYARPVNTIGGLIS